VLVAKFTPRSVGLVEGCYLHAMAFRNTEFKTA